MIYLVNLLLKGVVKSTVDFIDFAVMVYDLIIFCVDNCLITFQLHKYSLEQVL